MSCREKFVMEYRQCPECGRDGNTSVKYRGQFFCPWCHHWFTESGEITFKRDSHE